MKKYRTNGDSQGNKSKKGPNAQALAHANPKASFLRKKKGTPNAQAIAHANPKASFLKKKNVKHLRGGGGGKVAKKFNATKYKKAHKKHFGL